MGKVQPERTVDKARIHKRKTILKVLSVIAIVLFIVCIIVTIQQYS